MDIVQVTVIMQEVVRVLGMLVGRNAGVCSAIELPSTYLLIATIVMCLTFVHYTGRLGV